MRRYGAGTALKAARVFSASGFLLFITSASGVSEPWRFGVISDTQWQPADTTNQSVAIAVVDAVNKALIDAKVDLVLQVGDLKDNGSNAGLDMRAAHNAVLAEKGIRFYPVRGNHDGSLEAARHFPIAFPNLPGTPGAGGSSPALAGAAGHTYAFTHKNAKFILVDIFALDSGNDGSITYTIADYLPWISAELAASDHEHAFVLSHKNLLGQNHKDNVFGTPKQGSEDPGNVAIKTQDAFFSTLASNRVHFYISGHDHIHHRAWVASPDGKNSLHEIIGQSDSFKLYRPKKPFSPRDVPLAQEVKKVGYYIYTVDGPRVSVRHYAASLAQVVAAASSGPPVHWSWRETFGYALNGTNCLVSRNGSYRGIEHAVAAGKGYAGTRARILDGSNAVTAQTADGRPCAELVSLGWSPRAEDPASPASDVLTIWGMANQLGSDATDPYTLELSGDPAPFSGGAPRLYCRDGGRWVTPAEFCATNATIVSGPYDPQAGCTPGADGRDSARHTVWAVLNRTGDFAVFTDRIPSTTDSGGVRGRVPAATSSVP